MRQSTILLASIAIAVGAAFAPTVLNRFVNWDDQNTLEQNPDLNPPALAKLGRYWCSEHADLYIPVTYSFWSGAAAIAYDDATGHLRPGIFHAASILLHVLSAWLVFAILRGLRLPPLAGYFGALLFALHPVQVESVAWASGGKDVLSGMLSLAALWLYILQAHSTGRRRWMLYAITTFAFVLGMLAKPSAVVVPVIAGIIDLLILRRPWRQVIAWAGAWLVLTIPIIAIARAAQPAEYVAPVPWWFRPVVAWDALAFYLGKLALPVKLAIDYGRTPQSIWPASAGTIAMWLGLALVAIAIVLLARRARWAPAAAMVFVAALLPMLGFVRFDFQKYSTVADHYLYLAMLAPALAVGVALSRTRGRWLYWIVALWVLVLGMRSAFQCRHWRDSDELFAHALYVNADSLAAHSSRAYLASLRNRPDRAIAHYRAALRAHPDDPAANFNLANLLAAMGQPRQALAHYRTALAHALPADRPRMLNNYGITLASVGELDDARAQLARAVELDPGFVDARVNFGTILSKLNEAAQARAQFEAALRLDPASPAARLGLERLDQAPAPRSPATATYPTTGR